MLKRLRAASSPLMLPKDPLFEVLNCLGARDLLSMARVSRAHREAAATHLSGRTELCLDSGYPGGLVELLCRKLRRLTIRTPSCGPAAFGSLIKVNQALADLVVDGLAEHDAMLWRAAFQGRRIDVRPVSDEVAEAEALRWQLQIPRTVDYRFQPRHLKPLFENTVLETFDEVRLWEFSPRNLTDLLAYLAKLSCLSAVNFRLVDLQLPQHGEVPAAGSFTFRGVLRLVASAPTQLDVEMAAPHAHTVELEGFGVAGRCPMEAFPSAHVVKAPAADALSVCRSTVLSGARSCALSLFRPHPANPPA